MKEKKTVKSVTSGIVHIQSTFNNTIVTITNAAGDCLAWASGGSLGFKGTRKSTPFAAGLIAGNSAKKAMEKGIKEVAVYVKGPGSGRETAIRALQATGLKIRAIKDVTPIPHNGCRPRKKRRI